MYKKIFIYSFIFLLIDQLSKLLINLNMDLNESIELINNFFSITYVHNIGAAFSLLPGNRLLFIIIAIFVLGIIYLFFIKNQKLNKLEVISYSLLISGIIGNLIDRIIFGYVLDFLDFNIFGYNFAIFNFADSFIVISVSLLIIGLLGEKKCKN